MQVFPPTDSTNANSFIKLVQKVFSAVLQIILTLPLILFSFSHLNRIQLFLFKKRKKIEIINLMRTSLILSKTSAKKYKIASVAYHRRLSLFLTPYLSADIIT